MERWEPAEPNDPNSPALNPNVHKKLGVGKVISPIVFYPTLCYSKPT